MRKILSVVLAVVMLASFATLIPVSAATTVPELVITEVGTDTTGGQYAFSDHDLFNFIEVYNAGDQLIDLYEYGITLLSGLSDASGLGDKSFSKFTPIVKAGNELGTIATSNQSQANSTAADSVWKYYPTNPDTAVVEPGKTAVIWFFSEYSYVYAYNAGKGISNFDAAYNTIDAFRGHWNISADTVVVAVDANGSNATNITVQNKFGNAATATANQVAAKGANAAANDLMTGTYPSADGRFNLENTNAAAYGLAKSADFKAANALSTLKHSQITSYVYINYSATDPAANLLYKCTGGAYSSSSRGNDVTYNFTYTNGASEYTIGKAEGMLEYGDWLTCQYATPGKLLPLQAADFLTLGSLVNSTHIGKAANDTIVSLTENHVIFEEYFGSLPGWASTPVYGSTTKTYYLTGNINMSIVDGKLKCTNTAKASSALYDAIVTIMSATEVENALKSLPTTHADYGKNAGLADYVIEYSIKYLPSESGEGERNSARFVGITHADNGDGTFALFILRYRGMGLNSMRYNGTANWTNLDVEGEYGAANSDANVGESSIINKITNGKIIAGSNASNSPDSERLVDIDEPLKVKIVVDQKIGPYVYINDKLVSVPVNAASWGFARYTEQAGFGLFAARQTAFELDDIKITALADVDSYRAEMLAQTKPISQPPTGDATVYVVIAMAVAFISLAVLVVAKRRQSAK